MIPFIGLSIYIVIALISAGFSAVVYQLDSAQIFAQINTTGGTLLYTFYAWLATFIVVAISSLVHSVRGIFIPTFRLLF